MAIARILRKIPRSRGSSSIRSLLRWLLIELTNSEMQAYVLGRSSSSSILYSASDTSMDSLEGFSPQDTSGFIAINAIRLKKYGEQCIRDGKSPWQILESYSDFLSSAKKKKKAE